MRMLNCLRTEWLAAVLLLGLGQISLADTSLKLKPGEKRKVHGIIVRLDTTQFILDSYEGGEVVVQVSPQTKFEEQRRNFFRNPLSYSSRDLLPGLVVSVKGRGNGKGQLAAKSVKFTQQDLKVAQTLWSRVSPLEKQLVATESSLNADLKGVRTTHDKDTHNAQLRIEELDSAFRLSRQEARRARDTANHALDGLRQLEGRVAELDKFRVASLWTVRFGFNSSELSEEGKLTLNGIVEDTPDESTLFEVTGFTSADGDPAYNLRLSEKRAQQVVRYLVEELQIPLHRILIPFGFGSGRPEADNDTLEGRQLNRRVEVRALTNQPAQQTVAAR